MIWSLVDDLALLIGSIVVFAVGALLIRVIERVR